MNRVLPQLCKALELSPESALESKEWVKSMSSKPFVSVGDIRALNKIVPGVLYQAKRAVEDKGLSFNDKQVYDIGPFMMAFKERLKVYIQTVERDKN